MTNWPLRSIACLLLAIALLTAPGPARAQAAPPAAPKPVQRAPRTVMELARLVEEQRLLIEAQQEALTAQEERLAAQEKRLAELEQSLEAASQLTRTTHEQFLALQQKPADESVTKVVEARLAEVEQTVQRVPEMAVQNLQGDFPRSIKIPGTDAALRVGGLVRMTYINTFNALWSDDRFVTSSIPIAGSEEAGKTSRIEFSVVPSRFNLDLRTPTGVGHMRAFIELDAAGGKDLLRLRHAFGQWSGWLMGQTWSTFSDPEAEPDGLDFEGLNAISLLRQPQVRYSRPFGRRLKLAMAVEEANPSLTGATGVNQVPDLILRLRYDPPEAPFLFGLLREGSHVQAAILLRQLRGEVESPTGSPLETLSTTGYGINLSGVLPTPWANQLDRIRFAWNAGEGIGRYITDLGTLGGQDAVYDPLADELDPLPVASAYLGYEHWWRPTLRSTLTAGYVWVDNLDSQAADALHRTERYSLNLAWSPIPRLDLIAEYLWGQRINLDRQSGEAGQVQFGSTFRF